MTDTNQCDEGEVLKRMLKTSHNPHKEKRKGGIKTAQSNNMKRD